VSSSTYLYRSQDHLFHGYYDYRIQGFPFEWYFCCGAGSLENQISIGRLLLNFGIMILVAITLSKLYRFLTNGKKIQGNWLIALAAVTMIFNLPIFIMTTKAHLWELDIEAGVVRGKTRLQIGPFSW
jgi:hypothetical protein